MTFSNAVFAERKVSSVHKR